MYWHKFFFVTQSEKRGTLLLLVILFLLATTRIILAQYSTNPVAVPPKDLFQSAVIELNTADTTQLKTLRGIGSGYAKMIVNYRNKLGGFYSKQQLLEVYHFPLQTYQAIESQLQVDTTLITKIPINTAGIDALKRHPYIRYFQAVSLVQNRQKRPNGCYNSVQDMVLDKDVTPAFVQKIAPYLSFK